jgi:apolipoprotein N-acyltransferase
MVCMRTLVEISRRVGPHGRTALSALLIAASLPPWDLGFLAWVALVPWLSGLQRLQRFRQALAQGFWLSFAVGILVAHWLAYAAREFHQLSWPLSALVLALFAATCAQPHFVLWAPLVRWAERRTDAASGLGASLLLCLCLAFCYAGLDWLVPRLFDVGLGYALHGATRLRQVADLGGVALLTFSLVLVNLLVWRMWAIYEAGQGSRLAVASHAGLILVVWASAFLYGVERNREIVAALEGSDRSLRVGIAQGNIENEVRLAWARGDDRAAEKQLSTYMLLTEEVMEQRPKPDLVVWPEATFPGVFQQPASTLQRGRANKFDRQVLRLRVPIVFGAYDMTTKGEQRTLYNGLFAITPNYHRPGSLGFVQRYHKHELLAFAEHLPGLSQAAWFKRVLPSLGFFGGGPGASVFEIAMPGGDAVNLGPIICSEALSAQHVIDGARLGSAIILNVGSDGWFGSTGEPQFHLAISRLRSIETRRPQIRAANTGISALILPNGEIAERSEHGVEAILNLDVPIVTPGDSLMVRWGDWFGWVAIAPGLGLLIAIQLLASHRAAPSDAD